jgi:hypothetical protein
MQRTPADEKATWMQRTPADEKATWMQTLRALLSTMDAEQSASDRKRDLDHLESVVAKLDHVLSICAREGVEITADEVDAFERAKRLVGR